MSPRRYLVLSALIGALPLAALGALDVVLDVLNLSDLPVNFHAFVEGVLALLALVCIGWVLLPVFESHVFARGVETGQRMERAKHRDGPSGEVRPLRRQWSSPFSASREPTGEREQTM